ncbi:MAG: hypothetical protein AABW54_04585 [Candidatus Micrarchaeota archaeon]
MVSLTLCVPADLKRRMDLHAEIKWSEVVRSVIAQQLDALEEANRIASRSMLTERDVAELAESVDAGMARRWRAACREAGC